MPVYTVTILWPDSKVALKYVTLTKPDKIVKESGFARALTLKNKNVVIRLTKPDCTLTSLKGLRVRFVAPTRNVYLYSLPLWSKRC